MLISMIFPIVQWPPDVLAAADSPPVLVFRIVPPIPTAHPVFASMNETPESKWAVPLDCGVQVAPPSLVRRIVPPSPTTVPVLASVKDTARRNVLLLSH